MSTVDNLSYTPSEDSEGTYRDTAQIAATGRRSWKTLGGKGKAVWPPNLDTALHSPSWASQLWESGPGSSLRSPSHIHPSAPHSPMTDGTTVPPNPTPNNLDAQSDEYACPTKDIVVPPLATDLSTFPAQSDDYACQVNDIVDPVIDIPDDDMYQTDEGDQTRKKILENILQRSREDERNWIRLKRRWPIWPSHFPDTLISNYSYYSGYFLPERSHSRQSQNLSLKDHLSRAISGLKLELKADILKFTTTAVFDHGRDTPRICTYTPLSFQEKVAQDALKYPPLPNGTILLSKTLLCIPGVVNQLISSVRYSFY
ncbi:uncharacterized protein LACBIDRAFT_321437 [Laccaria bicolor S238N-H82]|uniref:Predicted protein n=1 Tax=Laccaria bicolor (strain S238N-H82 / ATCC MYA-4686) TaxID=486041 RepID=B0CQC9_LACBS|nr:uncharacterized protein LACBIDRAFT_321437 [Laccaria bicolor S238N-H82]EDR16184.1 predicted protein [Laccaria bicolor S238N-H82]|eukprot:XP_001874392.1 predicted protein [Laccaria bicolor S238N-H82]